MTAPPPDDRDRYNAGRFHNEAVERRLPSGFAAAGNALADHASAAVQEAKAVPGVRVSQLTDTSFDPRSGCLYHVTVAIVAPAAEPGTATYYSPEVLLALAVQTVERLVRG